MRIAAFRPEPVLRGQLGRPSQPAPRSDREEELEQKGETACPPESRVGGGAGNTVMTGFPLAGESPLEFDGWDYGSGVLLLGAVAQTPGLRMATRARRQGRVVTVDVPPSSGGPPDSETVVRRVHNIFDARSIGNRAYVRTPSICPSSGVWTFKVSFTWADGVITDDVSRMLQARPHAAPDPHQPGAAAPLCLARLSHASEHQGRLAA